MHSEEYELLFKRITTIDNSLNLLQGKVELLGSTLSSLRGLVNRKLERPRDGDHEGNREAGEESLNNPVILGDNGIPFKHR